MAASPFPSILVPVDGSASAYAALRLGLRLAGREGEVVIAHAIDRAAVSARCLGPYMSYPAPALQELEADERDIFSEAEAEARAAGVCCSSVALDGLPAHSICTFSRERKVGAIAIGTYGRPGPTRMLGSTAAGVLDRSACPTFVVHEDSLHPATRPFREILVALDASRAAEHAAHAAVDLAAHDHGSVTFVHVAETRDTTVPKKALADAFSYARTAKIPSDAAIVHGETARAILMSAEVCSSDLIALGARARGRAAFGMGSVAQAVARMSRVPVLVLPMPPLQQAA